MSLCSLSDISEVGEKMVYFNENKHKSWDEWLSYDISFAKPGKQGIAGLFKLTNIKNKKNRCVFKISQYINHLIQHESVVMNGLNDIASFCPHFCKFIGSIIAKVEPKLRKEGNPFKIETNHPIKKEVLLCDYVDKSYKFFSYIKATNDKINEEVLYSTIKQVLLAICIAQKKKQFTHYDLHSFNIMMKRCNKDVVFLYVLDKDNQFAVPTLGHYPVIIDFGFSYINNLEDGPLWPSMGHTNVGFMSDRFDWVADPKLFLVTVSGEIKERRKTKKSRKFRKVVRNMFHSLNIDWDSGWDKDVECAASDHILELVHEYNPGSRLFDDYEHYCIDIILTLVILPIEEQEYEEINKPYELFLKEFIKIENQISSPFYNLYVLKGIVDSARYVRAAYMDVETRKDAVKTFTNKIQENIAEIADFCRINEVNFEIMLCSLYIFSRKCEGVLNDVITTRMADKEREYNKLPLKSIEQMYGAIEINLPSDYVYNTNTNVVILDMYNQKCNTFKIPTTELDTINSIHTIARGTYIYDLYKNL